MNERNISVMSARGAENVLIQAEPINGISEAASPESVAAEHPGWAADMAEWGPWTRRGGVHQSTRNGLAASVHVFGRASSVLDAAWRFHVEGRLADWQSLLAVSQWAGRGQMRRAWISPPGNMHAALVLPVLPRPMEDLSSLLAGWLLCEAFASLGLRLLIKWPNDLLLNGRKVGGLLIEGRGNRTIVGIGINLAAAPPPEALRRERAVDAVSLAEAPTNLRLAPLGLWIELVDRARACYESLFPEAAPERLLAKVEARLAWLGERVRVMNPGLRDDDSPSDCLVGVVLGLASDGGLVLDVGGREVTLYSGAILPY